MKPMYLSIQQKETGLKIKRLLEEHSYTVKDIQGVMGFENPQAIYKWISGKSLPSLDNFIILSRLLHTSIENILVISGDFVNLWGKIFNGTAFPLQNIIYKMQKHRPLFQECIRLTR